MNCLSLQLNQAASMGRIGYHPKCKDLGITHLAFADDLLIFIDGSLASVQNVIEVLHNFHAVSGLSLNIQKTTFLAAGLSDAEILEISTVTGLTHATLPTTYLGLPLSSRKLSPLTAAPLLQKIKTRMSTWAAKMLSYAGRVQLLKSVINGITNFWCASFIIPKGCLKIINSYCSSFLWKGSIENRHSARVAWNSVTIPREEGGLGLRDLFAWNKSCTLKLIWMIFFQPSSLWAAWFRHEILASRLHTFWTIKPKASFSWLARRLIKCRTEIFPWIHVCLGNGRTTSFWSSNWSPYGSIAHYLSDEPSLPRGIPNSAMLSDLWVDGSWSLPPARSERQVLLQSHLSTITLNQDQDTYEWKFPNHNGSKFDTGAVYNLIRNPNQPTTWHKEVWFSGSIPKHSFLTWLFVLNRCPTRDRLLNWGLQTDHLCLLCNQASESRAHLFFECRFSSDLWRPVAESLHIPFSHSWDDTIQNLISITSPRHRKALISIAWQASIYLLWQERNQRMHRASFRSVDSLTKLLDSLIRNRCSSLRDSRSRFASSMLQLWFASRTHPSTSIVA